MTSVHCFNEVMNHAATYLLLLIVILQAYGVEAQAEVVWVATGLVHTRDTVAHCLLNALQEAVY